MILTLLRYPKLNKLNAPFSVAQTKLLNGEHYLIQAVDKKLSLTSHRLIINRFPWSAFGQTSLMLEDIEGWETKVSGKGLYFGLSACMAFLVYFNDSFALLSGFFLMLYLMTRQNRVHIKAKHKVAVLPFDIEEGRLSSLIEMVRNAKHNRITQLNKAA